MFRAIVEELFAQVQSVEIDPSLIEIPQDRSMGDFALPCFQFAKALKKSPQDIAINIAKEIENYLVEVAFEEDAFTYGLKVQAMGPYVNVTLRTWWVAQQTIWDVVAQWDRYGAGDNKNEILVLESPGPNTNKPLHLWHVRNMLLGNALSAIATYAGYEVKKVDIVNDRGIHICKSMLAYREFWNNEEPNKKSDHYVWDWYVRYDQELKKQTESVFQQYRNGDFVQRLEVAEDVIKLNEIYEKTWNKKCLDEIRAFAENTTDFSSKIIDMLVAWEHWDAEVRLLRRKMRDRALSGMRETYSRYGCYIDKAYYESDHYLKWKEIVLDGLKRWVFKKDSQWNIVCDEDIWNKILLRKNWTSIYITQDIALGQIRYTDWQMDRMVYVVGNEQADHFKFLFKIFERLGYEFWSKCHHLSYGMISLPDGKMKSREGNVVDADNLADQMQQTSLTQLDERYPDADNTQLAEHIAMWAIKFFVLKYDAKKDFVFDRDESLSFDGESGPYLQYTHARCNSILDKAKSLEFKADNIDYSKLDQDSERLICLHLSEFTDIVQKAADEYKPSLVARYVLELARMFNTYYQSTKVLVEDDMPLTQARLTLVASVQQVLHNGLQLLWIEAPEKM